MGTIKKNKHSIESAERKQIEKWLFESDKELQWIAQKLKNTNEDLIKAQKETTTTKDFLQNIVDSISEMIVSIDLSGKINQWNRMAELITGYSSNEVIGKKFSRLEFVQNKRTTSDYIAAMLKDPKFGSFELAVLTKERRKSIILLSASLLKDDASKPIGLAIVGKDITIKKHLHKQLSPGNSYLIKERTSEKAYSLFANKTETGSKGLCVTRTSPAIIRGKYGTNISTIWLSSRKNENLISASNLMAINYKVGDFINKNREAIILLDRIEYIINIYGFEEVLRFIYSLNEKVMVSDAVLILYVNPETLNPQWLSMLEQEIQRLPEIKEKEIELTSDLQEIVDFISDQKNINQIVSFKDVAKRFNITRSTARKRINSLQYTGLLDIKKKGRYKMLEIRDA